MVGVYDGARKKGVCGIDRTWAAVAGVALLLAGATGISTFWPRVCQLEVDVRGLPADLDGLRILHITDLHSRSAEAPRVDITRLVRELEFDLVALTGDLIDYDLRHLTPVLKLVGRLAPDTPVLSVAGNHDWSHGGGRLTEQLEAVGAESLENAATVLDLPGGLLTAVGVSDAFSGRADIEAAFCDVDAEFALVLTHDPAIFPELARRPGSSLVLAGHTHGGQIKIPGVATLYAPGQGFGPAYGHGLYREGAHRLYVSAGVGYTGILPFRLGIRPEIAVVTLRRVAAGSS